MKRSRTAIPGLLFCALLLGGCAAKEVTQPAQYTGFLADYSRLKPATSPTGRPVMRWVAPGVTLGDYRYLQVRSLGFHPPAQPTQQIDRQTLDQLEAYARQQLTAAFARRFEILEPSAPPRPQTLVLRAAITGVESKAEGLKPYEVIPIALVVAATSGATGSRNRTTALFVEAELLDATTGQPVAQVVRKGFGQGLKNREEKVTLATIKGVIDDLVRDIERTQ